MKRKRIKSSWILVGTEVCGRKSKRVSNNERGEGFGERERCGMKNREDGERGRRERKEREEGDRGRRERKEREEGERERGRWEIDRKEREEGEKGGR